MSKYYFFSFQDSLDGGDPAVTFQNKVVGVVSYALVPLKIDYPTAIINSIRYEHILSFLDGGLIEFAVYVNLAEFQVDAQFLVSNSTLNDTFFANEIADDGLINSVDPFVLTPDIITYGPDVIFGTRDADDYDALWGDDEMHGKGGDDRLLGSGGDDLIHGNRGHDILKGGIGDDTLIGGRGNDLMQGGRGIDTADYSASGSVMVDLDVTTRQATGVGNDRLIGIENLIGGSDASTLSGTDRRNEITGGNRGDIIDGRGGIDFLFGNGGKDTIYGGGGADTIRGGNGGDTVHGGNGDDWITERGDFGTGYAITTGNDRLFGNGGDDRIYGYTGNDRLFGGAGDDELYGGIGNDRLFGGAGNDRLKGEDGENVLVGGAGDDSLQSNGSDRLTGGAGSDTFVFWALPFDQVITDFELGVDIIAIMRLPYEDLVIDGETDAIIHIPDGYGGGEILVLGISADDLTSDNFIY